MLDHNSKGFASMFSLYCLEQPSSIDQWFLCCVSEIVAIDDVGI